MIHEFFMSIAWQLGRIAVPFIVAGVAFFVARAAARRTVRRYFRRGNR